MLEIIVGDIETIDGGLTWVGRYTTIMFLIDLYKKHRVKIGILINLIGTSRVVNPKIKEESITELIKYI